MKYLKIIFIMAAVFNLLLTNDVLADSKLQEVNLPYGLQISIPKNWKMMDGNQLIAFDKAATKNLSKIIITESTVVFAAVTHNSVEDIAKINVRYYPKQDITQDKVLNGGNSFINDFDMGLRQGFRAAGKAEFDSLKWLGTTSKIISGKTFLITNYKRPSQTSNSYYSVKLIRLLDGYKSFTITLSYNDKYSNQIKTICDKIEKSVKIINL